MCRFLQIARGSASELEYHLLLAHDLHMLGDENFHDLVRQVDEVQRMLTSLIQRFRPVLAGKETPQREHDKEAVVGLCS